LRSLAERYRSNLGPHPAVEELIAYHAGELPHEQQERLRDHLALCHDCAGLLRDLADFPDLAPPEGARPLSAPDVDGAWEEMEKRLGRAGRPESQTPPLGSPAVRTAGPRSAPQTPGRGWIRALTSLAAVLFLATIGLTLWALSLQRKLSQPQADVDVVHIGAEEPERGPGEVEAEVEAVEVSRPGRKVMLFVNPGEAAPERGELVISNAAGEVLWRGLVVEKDEYGAFVLELPRGFPASGDYPVQLFGLENGRRRLIVTRLLRVL
jgi:hypothetical protein